MSEAKSPGTLAAPVFGEMETRIREFDWSATPLGSPSSWSPALRTMVRVLLANRFPHILWWGPSYIQLYNDAYRPIPGTKHPQRVLGQPASACWPEIWHVIGPLIDRPFQGGPATWDDDLFLEVDRHGFREECHFTIAYSPVPDDTVEGGIGGVLGTVHEITDQIVGERRVTVLRDLGTPVAKARTADEVCQIAAQTFSQHGKDLPFVLLYLVDPGSRAARLAGAAGVEEGLDIRPAHVELCGAQPHGWPLFEAMQQGALFVSDIGRRFTDVPQGPWADPPRTAYVATIASNPQSEPAGFIVAGVSARLKWDSRYGDFLELARAQLATAIGNARAYEQEKQRAETLAELDRAKTAFFSNVSHEFRTPLTLMLGPVASLLSARQSGVSAAARDELMLVERNGLRLLRLVNSLLDFARIEAGRMDAEYRPTDLGAFTAELAGVFRSACEQAGLTLSVSCPPLPNPVFVDRGMWEKIVLNLMSNAFKFTFHGEIGVTLQRVGDTVELRVSDTGIGIPADELMRVFDRFHRVQGAQGRTHEGTGIGLALTRELVRLHGGSVHLQSRAGVGTTLIVTVPLGIAHLPPERIRRGNDIRGAARDARPFVEEALRWLPDQEGAAHAPAGPSADVAGDAGDRPLVLVVDDNADMRRYLCRLLDTHYAVTTATDGNAALDAVRRQRPDLVLTDVMMPGLDGFGLLRALRSDADTASVPIIMLSARAGEESRAEGAEAGADDYLVKPFGARELLARVGTQLQMARFRKDAEIAQQRRNRQFRTLLDQAPLGIFVVDAGMVIRDVNPAAMTMIGELPDGLLNRSLEAVVRDTWDTPQADAIVEAFRRTLETGEAHVVPEWSEHRIDRNVTEYYEWRVDRIPLPDGSNGLVCYFRDISGQVWARKRIEESEAVLRDADRRKDEFLTILAHELRGPLATIDNAAQILDRSFANSELSRDARGTMQRQMRHLVRLIDDLLDVGRIAQGKLKLRIERVELQRVLRDAIEMSRPQDPALERAIIVDVPDTPIFLDADAVRVAQILGNLIGNARKYTEPGGHVWITVERRHDSVLVRVRDDGIGMAMQTLRSIFDLFMQVDASRDRSRGGLGVGLSLVKRLVEMHGGSVEAFSDGPSQGSEFRVTLPLGATRDDSRPAAEQAQMAAHARRQILVVDDDVDSARSLAAVLALDEHVVHAVHDGGEALTAVERERPDVVLMDIGLPTLSGYEVARRIRAKPWGRQMMLIAVSGRGQDEDRRRSLEAGFDAHLVKPFDSARLAELLASGANADRT